MTSRRSRSPSSTRSSPAGTIATLLAVPFIAARIGRRGVMLAAVATMMVAAALLAAWKALPGLLARAPAHRCGGRAGRRHGHHVPDRAARPCGSERLAESAPGTIGTAVNVGALGIGPLVAGCLAAWVRLPLTLPYLSGSRSERSRWSAWRPRRRRRSGSRRRPRASRPSRSARLPVPAAAATLAAFAANGLFAGLSGLFLATTLHHPSHALAGATLFLVFSAGRGVSARRQRGCGPRACSRSARSRCSSVSCCS